MLRTRRSLRTVAALTAAALWLAGCGGDDDPTVEVSPTTDADDAATADDGGDDVAAGDGTDEDVAASDEPEDDGAGDAGADEGAGDDGAAAGPRPDPALVADPCGPEEGREGESFITVVAPVADQLVDGDTVDLVGCSNVFEANVQWALYDGDGNELDAGFTTAECGNGCVGAFEEPIPLDAAEGEPFAELHVFSEDVSDEGGQQHLVTIPLVLA